MNTKENHVLIIDDDDRNIFALKAVLTARGFRCSTATSGAQALAVLSAGEDISAALVDMMMPDMDGYELMAKIRSIPLLTHLRLIAVTAQAMVGDREKCLAAGAEAYISKPVDIDRLLEVLAKPLNGNGC